MKKKLFPIVIGLAALSVSGSAAFYSVFGLSKLFAGASLQVIIMAGSLEFAKLVVASLLYQYWDTINKALRLYLSIATLILMIITSGGIYGFLSGAYQSTATQSELLDKSLAILQQKQIRFEENKQDLKYEKEGLTKSISNLRISLSNPAQVQYVDKESGQLITTTSSSSRRALQDELARTLGDRNIINNKLAAIEDSITKTDIRILDKQIDNEDQRELGPLKYLAETTGQDMNTIVNWFLLLIIFVFDPLAIALVVAANMAFTQIKPKELVTKELYTDEDEKRINVIGQNGNDGLHYDQEEMIKKNEQILATTNTKEKSFNDLKNRIKENQDKLQEKAKEDIYKEKPAPKQGPGKKSYW